jgi:hypothetical protein
MLRGAAVQSGRGTRAGSPFGAQPGRALRLVKAAPARLRYRGAVGPEAGSAFAVRSCRYDRFFNEASTQENSR